MASFSISLLKKLSKSCFSVHQVDAVPHSYMKKCNHVSGKGRDFIYSSEAFLNDWSKVLLTLRSILAYSVNHQGEVEVPCSPFRHIDNLISLAQSGLKSSLQKEKKNKPKKMYCHNLYLNLFGTGPDSKDCI